MPRPDEIPPGRGRAAGGFSPAMPSPSHYGPPERFSVVQKDFGMSREPGAPQQKSQQELAEAAARGDIETIRAAVDAALPGLLEPWQFGNPDNGKDDMAALEWRIEQRIPGNTLAEHFADLFMIAAWNRLPKEPVPVTGATKTSPDPAPDRPVLPSAETGRNPDQPASSTQPQEEWYLP